MPGQPRRVEGRNVGYFGEREIFPVLVGEVLL